MFRFFVEVNRNKKKKTGERYNYNMQKVVHLYVWDYVCVNCTFWKETDKDNTIVYKCMYTDTVIILWTTSNLDDVWIIIIFTRWEKYTLN